MLKYLFILALFSTLSVWAGLPLTAHWDFSKGSINSVDGKRRMKFRGSSAIVNEKGVKSLLPGKTRGPVPSGIECNGGWKGLSPEGAFRIETEVRFNEPTSNRAQMFLYDTKNVAYISKSPRDNVGILFYVIRNFKRKDFVLAVSCGAGTKSFRAVGRWTPCKVGKKYLLSVEYDPAGKVTFSIDGKKTVVKTAFGGPLAPGFRRPVIGDRCGSNYSPFDGNIYWLKLYSAQNKTVKAPVKLRKQPKAPVKKSVRRSGYTKAVCIYAAII